MCCPNRTRSNLNCPTPKARFRLAAEDLVAGQVGATLFSTAQECKKYLESDIEDHFVTEGVYFSKPVIFSQPTVVDSRTASFRVMDGNRFFFHLTSGNSKDLVWSPAMPQKPDRESSRSVHRHGEQRMQQRK